MEALEVFARFLYILRTMEESVWGVKAQVTARLASAMGRLPRMLGATVVLLGAACAVRAQQNQMWPEVDTYLKTGMDTRLSLFVLTTRENGAPYNVQVNPNFDYFLKWSFEKLRRFSIFRVDEAKSRPLDFRVGYTYLTGSDQATQNWIQLELTPRLPLLCGFSAEDRNRGELRWINGVFSTLYRNRLTIDRTLGIHGYHPTPLARAELFYDTRYDKINETQLTAGIDLPIKKSGVLEIYYTHTNNTSKPPNTQTNAVGLQLSLYFPWKK